MWALYSVDTLCHPAAWPPPPASDLPLWKWRAQSNLEGDLSLLWFCRFLSQPSIPQLFPSVSGPLLSRVCSLPPKACFMLSLSAPRKGWYPPRASPGLPFAVYKQLSSLPPVLLTTEVIRSTSEERSTFPSNNGGSGAAVC